MPRLMAWAFTLLGCASPLLLPLRKRVTIRIPCFPALGQFLQELAGVAGEARVVDAVPNHIDLPVRPSQPSMILPTERSMRTSARSRPETILRGQKDTSSRHA